MTASDIVRALAPLARELNSQGIGFHVGGSVASSAHGLPRATIDVDIVADIRLNQVEPLVAALENAYYIDGDMLRDAIRRRASCNLIHLGTMLKVDVFILKRQPYDLEAFRRAEPGLIDGVAFPLSGPEDIALHKLYWFKLGGGVSERQWNDVLGVLKVQADGLDLVYMRRWAPSLGVVELLEAACSDAGLSLGPV